MKLRLEWKARIAGGLGHPALAIMVSVGLHAALLFWLAGVFTSRPERPYLLFEVSVHSSDAHSATNTRSTPPARSRAFPRAITPPLVVDEKDRPADSDARPSSAQLPGSALSSIDGERLEAPPLFLYQATPEYPEFARRMRQSGKVLLMATIQVTGQAAAVTVVQSGGFWFDQAALSALRSSRFQPARRGGSPVEVKVMIPFVFTLAARS